MIRVATIGTSAITRHFAAAVRVVDDIEITCAYSRDADRAAQLARELGAPGSASDLTRLLESPAVDAVYIASPNSVHHTQAVDAVRAGKHVLVEKPAVLTAADWVDLTTEAAAAGVVVLEGIRNEYDPGIELVRSMLPFLGPVRRVSFRYQSRSARYDDVLAGRRVNIFDPAMGGGALMDLGVYCAHALITLFGPPEGIAAEAVTIASGVDGAGAALARYPTFVADLNYSKITSSTLPSEIQGEGATLLIDHIASPRTLTLLDHDGSTETRTTPDPQHTLEHEVDRFVQLVRTGGDATVDHERTRQTLELLDAIRGRTRTDS